MKPLLLALLTLAPTLLPADDAIVEDAGVIQSQIEQAAQAGQKQVVIAPGTYRLKSGGPGKVHLEFKGLKNIEIVATGVTFIFTTPEKSSMRFEKCENVTFRGATLIRDPIPFSQGKITAIAPDGKSVDVQVDAGYPTDVENPTAFGPFWLNLFDDKRHWRDDTSKATSIQKTGSDSFRFSVAHKFPSDFVVGSHVAWRGKGGTDIDLPECEGMKILDVTIKSGSGFCVHEDGGEGHNTYTYTLTFGPRPPGATEDPLLASNADGFHSSGVRHGPTLINCHFEGMNDDGIAIHGKYALVQQLTGNDLIVQTTYHRTYCRPGDTLRFIDDKGAAAGEAKVTAVADVDFTPTLPAPKELRAFATADNPSFEKITLDNPVPAQPHWLVNNENACGDGFVIRGCTVKYNRARNMMLKASDGLIEDSIAEGGSMGGIVFTPEMGYWNEADYARNIVIRHNTLINCDYFARPDSFQAGALTVAAFEHHQYVPLPGGHQNITIEDNTFQNDDGTNILITSAQDVTIKDNHFVAPMQNETARGTANHIDPTALITLKQCSGVTITGNTLTNPGPYFKKEIDAASTASGTGFQDGITQQ
jgi:hypothetical protein